MQIYGLIVVLKRIIENFSKEAGMKEFMKKVEGWGFILTNQLKLAHILKDPFNRTKK